MLKITRIAIATLCSVFPLTAVSQEARSVSDTVQTDAGLASSDEPPASITPTDSAPPEAPEIEKPDETTPAEEIAAPDISPTSDASAETAAPAENASDDASPAAIPSEGESAEIETPIDSPPKPKKKKRKKIRISARVHAAWKMTHENTPDNPATAADEFEEQDIENKFTIRQARFKFRWTPEKWLTAALQLAGFQDNDFGISLLRDAYIHVSPFRYLEIRAGLFKKPFSRLQQRSVGKLRVLNRGEMNDLIVEDLRFGERDLGLQLSGRILPSIKLDYEVGVFNGSGPDISERGNSKDVVARIETSPAKWFSFGTNGSFKFFDESESNEEFAWAAGADAVFKVSGFRAHLEGIAASDYNYENRPNVVTQTQPTILGLVGILSYKHKLSSGSFRLALEPVFKVEMLDPNHKVSDDQVLTYDAGFNSYIGKYLRLMIHGEFRRPAKNSAASYPGREILTAQLCFDI